MNFWKIVGWGMTIPGMVALFWALRSLIQGLKNPRCPNCQIRDSKPIKRRRPYVRSDGESIDRVREGRECNGCHTLFAFSGEYTEEHKIASGHPAGA